MNTRMSRYHMDEEQLEKRVDRNKDIYTKVNEDNIENADLTDNISIINADTRNLNLNDLKSILDKKYQRKSVNYYDDIITDDEEDLEITKEYDLKKAIDDARRENPVDYDRDRFKKVRSSEYEILNSLNLKKKSYIKPEALNEEEETLMTLIETVNANEAKIHNKVEDDDLLGDLVGNDNTEVLEPVVIEDTGDITMEKPTVLEEIEKTKQLSRTDILDKLEEDGFEEETESEKIESQDNDDYESDVEEEPPLVNTFYTGNLSIKNSDLDDFKDLEKELGSSGIFVKILVLLVVLIILVVGVYFLNKYLNLGLF